MAHRSKVLWARRAIRVTVTTSPGGKVLQHLQQLAPVGAPAGHRLAAVRLDDAYVAS